MSKESAKLFFEKLENDHELQASMHDAIKEITDSVQSKDIKKMREIFEKNIITKAKELGYDFTIEEIPQDAFQKTSGKMSLEELDSVSGGKITWNDVKGVLSDIWAVITDADNQKKAKSLYENFAKNSY